MRASTRTCAVCVCEGAHELLDVIQVARDIARDEDVGALVDGERAARREEVFRALLDLLCPRIADGDEARLERA